MRLSENGNWLCSSLQTGILLCSVASQLVDGLNDTHTIMYVAQNIVSAQESRHL